MKRALVVLATALALLVSASAASAASEWRSEQPITSPAIGVPTELGEIGDIEFWAPNRGLLITAGNGGTPAGLFAYDGTGWYRYSTVCGGHRGRIAWAGPSDFWTISDQQVGQDTGSAPAQHISLCHFVNGVVVASYGKPLGQADSYLPMSSAACAGPNDCWFGGERLPGTVNKGAFHLHWDGSKLTALPSLTAAEPELGDPGRSVVDLAYQEGRYYESVAVAAGDSAPGESIAQPSFLHQIVEGPNPFVPLPVHGTIKYGGAGASAENLEGFLLDGDSSGLWAISGAREETPATVTALHKGPGEAPEPVTLKDAGGVLAAGDGVTGIAAEPGTNYAWVGFRRAGEFESAGPARLTKIHTDGTVDAETVIPDPAEKLGSLGTAGPLTCPATGQCWMATSKGWLFHRGPDLARDDDPSLHVLVTSRPRDESLPTVAPTTLPEDDSGNYEAAKTTPIEIDETIHRKPALYANLKQKLLQGNVLQLSFKLNAKAKVQLLAKRKGKVVAKTAEQTLAKGNHKLRLKLDPKRWPTKLDLRVHAVKTKSKGKKG